MQPRDTRDRSAQMPIMVYIWADALDDSFRTSTANCASNVTGAKYPRKQMTMFNHQHKYRLSLQGICLVGRGIDGSAACVFTLPSQGTRSSGVIAKSAVP